MSTNAFRRLQALLPPPPVLVGLVLAHHEDDTSTVQLPGAPGEGGERPVVPVVGDSGQVVGVGANIFTGPVIRARGRTVPVGKKAFVRSGVIETQAPDGDVLEIVVGNPADDAVAPGPVVGLEIVEQAPPSTVRGSDVVGLRTEIGEMQYAASYGAGTIGIGGTFYTEETEQNGVTLTYSPDGKTVTFLENENTAFFHYAEIAADLGSAAPARRAVEFVIVRSEARKDLTFATRTTSSSTPRLTAVLLTESGRFNPSNRGLGTEFSVPPLQQGDTVGIVIDNSWRDTDTSRLGEVTWYRNGQEFAKTYINAALPSGRFAYVGRDDYDLQ